MIGFNGKAESFDSGYQYPVCLVESPGKETCGPEKDKWDFNRVCQKISEEGESSTLFVLPLATIIETGNHITHSPGDVFELVNSFSDLIISTIEEKKPWAAFTAQSGMWSGDGLRRLIDRWTKTAVTRQSLGDASIVDVAEYYAQMGYQVEILTGDQGLKAYEPRQEVLIPRRRQ